MPAQSRRLLSYPIKFVIGDILEKLPEGVDAKLGGDGTYLSGGEQQRIALARAILKDAPIVVLEDGRVSEQGAPAELLAADGAFAHMVELQGASAAWSV